MKFIDVFIMGVLYVCVDLGDFEKGRFVYRLFVELDFDRNVLVVNFLIFMYCKCKDVDIVVFLFGKLWIRIFVFWNVMILGFV